jgi:transmembrane sensor
MAEEPFFGLRAHLEPRWNERRAAQVRAALERRVRDRRSLRRVLSASSLALAGGIVVALFVKQKLVGERPTRLTAPAEARPPLAQPMATPLTAETELVVDPEGAGRAFVLRRGRARFVVPHDERHPFRVRVGPLVVEDVGTIFSVSRLSANKSDVAVEEGRVAVLCDGVRVELGGGARRTFECGQPERDPAPAPAGAIVPEREAISLFGSASGGLGRGPRPPGLRLARSDRKTEPSLARPSSQALSAMGGKAGEGTSSPAAHAGFAGRTEVRERDTPPVPSGRPAGLSATASDTVAELEPPPAAPAWQILAERGRYDEAYDSLRKESQKPVRDETHELLLAADTARLSGHSSEAVPYLRRILLRHREDPRAHLVAFTLGRVLLDELGQPAEAAEAFERARASRGPLAEDALAREVEACARAGDAGRAHALALEYRRTYPQGRRMRAVATFGGLVQ